MSSHQEGGTFTSPLGFTEHTKRRDGPKDLKIPRLTEEEDIESFVMFESVTTSYKWTVNELVAKLALCLSGNALRAFNSLSTRGIMYSITSLI